MEIISYVNFYAGIFQNGEAISYNFAPGGVAWLQLARGAVKFDDYELKAGDGVAINQESSMMIRSIAADTKVLLFDMTA